MIRKIAWTGDIHLDERHGLAECERIISWITDDAKQRGCCAIVCTGDLYEREATTDRERRIAASWAQSASRREMHWICIAGNHDSVESIEYLNRLESFQHFKIRGIVAPEVVRLSDFEIACLPWPRKSALVSASADAEAVERDSAQALQNVLRGLGQRWSWDRTITPRVFAGHVMMRASRVGATQPPLVGQSFELGPDDLALVGASFYGLGHIHLGQEWRVPLAVHGELFSMAHAETGELAYFDHAPVVYTGDPYRRNFGEPDTKSYVVTEFDADRLVGWERVETPTTPMHLIEAEWVGAFEVPDITGEAPMPAGLYFGPGVEPPASGVVRMRYRVSKHERDAAKAAAQAWKERAIAAGCQRVVIEERVEVETRARAPEVGIAATPAEKLCAYWKSVGFEPDLGRKQSLLAKLATLETLESCQPR